MMALIAVAMLCAAAAFAAVTVAVVAAPMAANALQAVLIWGGGRRKNSFSHPSISPTLTSETRKK